MWPGDRRKAPDAMTEAGDWALLPTGLQDLLAPQAAQEAAAVEALIATCSAFGYERIKPPLLEFEETLFEGTGAAVAQQSFRLMDPISQRMMALRADITPQVARIAASRLKNAPRPLRLCYGGQVLRVRGTQLRPERQVAQAGAELIGASAPEADAEVVVLAAEAVTSIGVEGLSVDLNQPTLVAAVAAGLGLDEGLVGPLRDRLDRKDAAGVSALVGPHDRLFLGLLRAAGPAARALDALGQLELPDAARQELAKLARVAALVRAAAPDLELTVDPVEHRSFEYQTGVSFTLFARDLRGELGRGGRYHTERPGGGEACTGFTLYMDTICRALPVPTPQARVFLPFGAPPDAARALRAEGWSVLAGILPAEDPRDEARRLGCSHLWIAGEIEALGD